MIEFFTVYGSVYVITPKGGWLVSDGMTIDADGVARNSKGQEFLLVSTPELTRAYREKHRAGGK